MFGLIQLSSMLMFGLIAIVGLLALILVIANHSQKRMKLKKSKFALENRTPVGAAEKFALSDKILIDETMVDETPSGEISTDVRSAGTQEIVN